MTFGPKSKYHNAPRQNIKDHVAAPVRKAKITPAQADLMKIIAADDIETLSKRHKWRRSASILIIRKWIAWTTETKTGMKLTDKGKEHQ